MTAILLSLAGFAVLCAATAFSLHHTLPKEPDVHRLTVGQRVRHPIGGCGTVCRSMDKSGMVVVAFDRGTVHLVAVWNLKPAKAGQTS